MIIYQIQKQEVVTTKTTTVTFITEEIAARLVQCLSFKSYCHNRNLGMKPEELKSIGFEEAEIYEALYLKLGGE